jgi:hypothetical protein
MKTKPTQLIPAVLALLAIGFCYFSQGCISGGQACFRTWLDRTYLYTVSPLYFFSLYFLPIAVIAIFVPRRVFNSWLKFAAWAIPLAIIFMATQQVYPAQILSSDRDDAARLTGEIFSVASFILIIWKSIVYHRIHNRQN